MLEEIKNIKSEKSDLRNFGITFSVILLVIAGFSLWKEKESFQIFLAIGIILFLTAITIPVILKLVYWVWMVFATILGWFMTRLILSLLFYAVVTPIGVVSRLVGKRFLELRSDKLKDSYWNYRDTKKPRRVDYERQF
jgi:polyferredoxin